MQVDDFVNKIRKLSEGSVFKPHKYILLLSVIELIEEKYFTDNKIFYGDKVKKRFTKYFDLYSKKGDSNRPHTPFFHLKSSDFWHFKAKSGKEGELSKLTTVGSQKDLDEYIDYAYMNSQVFKLLNDHVSLGKIKNELIAILKEYKYEKSRVDADTVFETTTDYGTRSLFLHESNAINEIKTHVDHLGKLISNILLYDNQSNNYFEIDILLATNYGIFVIELKHWTGHIRIEPHNWVVNDTNYRADPRKINSFKAKLVKGIYQHHFKVYPNIWVESVVVFTNPAATIEGANAPGLAADQKVTNPTFASIGDLVTYLKRRASTGMDILDNQQVDAVISYFSSLNQPKKGIKYTVPGYETVEYIYQSPESIELIARPLHGAGKGLFRFRIFRTPHNLPFAERERFKIKAHNTIKSISQIGNHPNIHRVWTIENEVGDIIEGTEWSETGTLRDLILKNKHKFSLEKAMQICCGIAEALKEAHKKNVIHRSIKPENILMVDDIPKLINFDLAYQLEDNRLTVIEDASELKDDGYIAPEIILGQDIDERTDYFSLGVIAYELLSGVKPFSTTRKFIMDKGKLNEEALQRLKQTGVPLKVTNIIENMILGDRRIRTTDIDEILMVFKEVGVCEDSKEISLITNRKLPPGSMHDVYEIVEYIGGGKESQVYKARTLRNTLVALKLFNREVPRERIFTEAEITSAINSAYVVRCDNKIGYWNKDRYFLVLDYVAGTSLRSLIEAGKKPDLSTFKTIALGLMEAIRAFHLHRDSEGNIKPYLHSDIKPDNIIITNDKKGILIDCGASGEPRVDTFRGTIGYVPPDCLSGTDMSFSEDGDLFALGVTLWEWLFGCRPYDNPDIGDVPDVSATKKVDLPEHIVKWLTQAVATENKNRFSTINEMRKAFIMIEDDDDEFKKPMENKKVLHVPAEKRDIDMETPSIIYRGNPFVAYLNSLSNVSAGNENATAEAQITSDYFSRIKVKNPITEFVYEKLMSEGCNVILTGNAGDGKTTIAMEIFSKITGTRRSLRPYELLEGQGLIIIKDMSELSEKKRISVLNNAVTLDKKHLIVSNTGTLIETFKLLKKHDLETSDDELLKALESDKPCTVFNDHFLVLNIGRMDSIETACAVFERMLEKDNWVECQSCKWNKECPICINVLLLQKNIKTILERIILLYRRLFEYNVRLTMRQMTGHLAYAISGGLECNDVMGMSQTALINKLNDYLFHNRFFGDDGVNVLPSALQLFPVRQILREGFGTILEPYFERKAWMQEKAPFIILDNIGLPQNVIKNVSKGADFTARRQLRRLVYFFGQLDNERGRQFITTFLRSPMLLEYIGLLGTPEGIAPTKESLFRSRILQVLQEYFVGVKLPEERQHSSDLYITVGQGTSSSSAQMVAVEFRSSDFKLVVEPNYSIGDRQKRMLCLQLQNGHESIKLDLPFFDYVARRYEGEITEELSPFYADRLERFKVNLTNHYYKTKGKEEQRLRLLMIGTDRKFKFLKMVIDDNTLEVL